MTERMKMFTEYAKSTKFSEFDNIDDAYADYVKHCDARRIRGYVKSYFAHLLQEQGVNFKSTKNAEIGNTQSETTSEVPEIPVGDAKSDTVSTEAVGVNNEAAQDIAATYETEQTPQTPTQSPLEQLVKKYQIDPETIGKLPVSLVEFAIKKYIYDQGELQDDEKKLIEKNSVELISKYAGELANEYAPEINFGVAVSNPLFRNYMLKYGFKYTPN